MAESQQEFEAIATVLRKLCRSPLPDLAPNTPLEDLPDMDSLRVLQVIALLEEQFGVEIDAGDLDRMSCVADVVSALHAALRGSGA